jgi:hypothetical protein
MPAMLRIKGKAERIAYSILGVPANLRKKRTKKRNNKVRNRLDFEETIRVR